VKPLAELGLPGFEMQSWQGIFAPAGTPAPVVDRLARELAAIVKTPEVRAKLLTLGVAPDGRGSAAFSQFQRSDIDKWGKVGIQAD
jgi:tripartite-type tricarboxylate transporter receptor subunit TctC